MVYAKGRGWTTAWRLHAFSKPMALSARWSSPAARSRILGNPFRGPAPVDEVAGVSPPLLAIGLKVTGKKFMSEYPSEDPYFRPYARRFPADQQMRLIVLEGTNRVDAVHQPPAHGFAFVVKGRALLPEPDLIDRWQKGDAADSLCIHCNDCVPTIYRATHCVLVPLEDRPGHSSL